MKKLIIFEGIDGSGKTTQARYFAKKLKAVYLFEPKFFRQQIFSSIQPLTELFLFLADRSEVYGQIKNFLLKKNVILDRSFPSTLAYQLEGRNLKKLISINDYLKIDLLARQSIQPDIVIIFDLPVKVALSRLKKKTKFEKLKFLEKVRKAYLKLAKKFDWYVIDANQSREEIKSQIFLILQTEGLLK
ncbi:MAG: dTMP kinase [Candidatus Parcubacteria bacterium]|nr:MAG: dTMP kinase [Candidatus Parcubacteria bacterium]